MLNLLKKRLKNEKGLTLVELLAVIVILGIVAAIAIPAIGSLIDNSRIKAVKADIANVINATNIYYTEHGKLPENQAALKPYIESFGTIQTITSFSRDQTTNEITITGTAKTSNGKTYNFTDAKLSTLNVESAKLEDTGISEGSQQSDG